MDKLFNKEQSYDRLEEDQFDQNSMVQLIQDHLIREGQFDIHDQLYDESQICSDLSLKSYFITLRDLLEQIKQKNLLPVIEWVNTKKEQLRMINSNLLFNLHKQHFVHLVKTEGRDHALKYVRANDIFKPFSTTNLCEIQQLMTSLLYLDTQKEQKYQEYYNEKNWDSLKDQFSKDMLKIKDQLYSSALQTSFQVGLIALPKFIKYYSLAGNIQNNNKNEIPIDVELGKEFKFHSFFVCPVSREVTGPENPPKLLKCGHVVSKQSIEKMTNNPAKQKFKCPTCPMEQKPDETKEIHFL